MARYGTRSRVTAVFYYFSCWCNMHMACMFYRWTAAAGIVDLPLDLPDFIQRHANKFLTTGSVQDLPRAHRNLKVPDAEVLRCATAFKGGYTRETAIDADGEVPGVRHYFFTSMAEACEQCETLRAVMRKYDCSAHYLLKRMKKLDKNLKRVRLDYKIRLTDKQIASRQAAAAKMLSHHNQDPEYLQHVCWVDEWHMWCTARDANLKVWADAHDARVHQVLPTPQLKSTEKPICIRCVAVVNAILGPIHMEFTTGTTDLKRELLKDVKDPYMVGTYHMLLCKLGSTLAATPSSTSQAALYIPWPQPLQSSSPSLTLP